MTVSQLEKRLSALEAQVADLQRTTSQNSSPKKQRQWWNEIAGVFANNPRFDKAMELGRQSEVQAANGTHNHRKSRKPRHKAGS